MLKLSLLVLLLTAPDPRALCQTPESELLAIEPLSDPVVTWAGATFGHGLAVGDGQLLISNPSAVVAGSLDSFLEVYTRVAQGWTRQPPISVPWPLTIADFIGAELSLDGDSVAVSAHDTQRPYVCVFDRQASGNWVLGARIDNPSTTNWGFGASISLSGDRLAIGEPAYPLAATNFVGAVLLYERVGGVWTFDQRLQLRPPHAQFRSRLGMRVELDGDRLVAKAETDATLGIYDGLLYVFERDASNRWWMQDVIYEPGAGPWDNFGASISLKGDTLVVGKPIDDFLAQAPGEVLVYEHGAGGAWTRTASWRSTQPSGGDLFGISVDQDGDLVVVGAARFPDLARNGRAFVYQRNTDGTWPSSPRNILRASDGKRREFGLPVAIGGGVVVVGDRGDTLQDQAVFVYVPGEARDLCTSSPTGVASPASLDTLGSPFAGADDQGVILSHCVPGTSYVVFGSLTGNANGCGPGVGTVPLCLCGRVARVAIGSVGMGTSIAITENDALLRPADRWLSVATTVHLQAFVAEPQTNGPRYLTNAVSLTLR